MIKKILLLSAALLLVWASACSTVRAEVFTEKTGGGRADSIYVAGNPDDYPIEYYDPAEECYKGLIPDLLREVSEKTGLHFTYISAGSENEQKYLYRNHQVELVTDITEDNARYRTMDKAVVLTVERGDKTERYCIGFTEVLTKAKKEAIKDALAEIDDEKKNGLLIDNAKEDLASSQRHFTLVIVIAAALVLLAGGIVVAVLVSKRKRKEKINRMIDPQTGVGNADYYTYAFQELMSEQAKSLYGAAYIAFDTKTFEEQKSHVLSIADIEKCAATKLSGGLSAVEYLSHVGQGAFLVLFQAENADVAEEKMQELVASLNGYVAEFFQGCETLFHGGYFRFCDDLGIDAETALYYAKQGYLYAEEHRLPCHIGLKEQVAANRKAQRLTAQIDTALQKGEFKVYMQFFWDSAEERFCGAEILSRWQNSEFGLLRPDEYIGILTKSGKIVEHDYKIFEEVCALLERWNKPPFDRLFLSCNFTRLSVSDKGFARHLAEIAEKYTFSRDRLVVEITESSLATDSEAVSDNIKQLTEYGFRVAIDDMGAGFSSLADIYDNIVDIVKIEREFVSSCVTERRQVMLGNILTLIHNAGAKVICEGVETEQQMKMLDRIGCDMIQGFYKSRVLPLAEGERFFRARQSDAREELVR